MDEFRRRWEIAACADYLIRNNHHRVTVQFPDELLSTATQVAAEFEAACSAAGHKVQVSVLADTTYNSLSVDEVAAHHVEADCVIHYGRASMTRLSWLPAFYVFPGLPMDVTATAHAVVQHAAALVQPASDTVLIFLDQPYLHARDQLRDAVAASIQEQQQGDAAAQLRSESIFFADVPSREMEPVRQSESATCSGSVPAGTPADGCCAQPQQGNCSRDASGNADSATLGGYTWDLPPGVAPRDCAMVWIGAEDAPALLQLQLTYNSARWGMLDPTTSSWVQGLPSDINRTLKKRYYLVEKARNARLIGILVGTLGAAGYLDALARLRALAKQAGKKTYTILMGKPSPAKLANFPEIEVFVMIADPQGLILDSKEYYAPIITPHEAELAFSSDSEWEPERYRLDFDGVLQASTREETAVARSDREPRYSLISNTYHGDSNSGAEGNTSDASTALALRAEQMSLANPAGHTVLAEVKSAADYFLTRREFTGLETPLVGAPQAEVKLAVAGRCGRAAGYANEGT